jgi:hypothetical protein
LVPIQGEWIEASEIRESFVIDTRFLDHSKQTETIQWFGFICREFSERQSLLAA